MKVVGVHHIKGGVERLLGGSHGVGPAIKGTDLEGLDLVPAGLSARNLESVAPGATGRTKRLARLLKRQHESYDLVILDCQPSISRVSENVFRVADLLLVPRIPATLSARTLELLLDFLAKDARYRLLRVAPSFSMVDRRRRLHLDHQQRLREQLPGFVEPEIPYSSDVDGYG